MPISHPFPSHFIGPYLNTWFAITPKTSCRQYRGLGCQGHACSEPVQNFEQLEQQLRDRQGLIL